MVKPIDITNTVIVPKPQPRYDKLKSFFVGRAPVDNIDESEVEVEDRAKARVMLFQQGPKPNTLPNLAQCKPKAHLTQHQSYLLPMLLLPEELPSHEVEIRQPFRR
jgi:hypothetical protein